MHIKNNIFKSIYRFLFLVLCEAGIILQYAAISKTGNRDNLIMLSCYYTMISNFICFLYFAYLTVIRPKSEKSAVKGAMVMCIALTGIAYHLLLSGNMETVGILSPMLIISNQLVHTVVPIMVFFDYLLFTPKGSFKSFDPLTWTLIPIAYLIFAVVRAEISPLMFSGFGGTSSRYPYPFMDFDLLGTGKGILIIIVMSVIYIAMGYLLYVLDRLLGKKRKS